MWLNVSDTLQVDANQIDLTAEDDVTILSNAGNVNIDADDQVLIATNGDALNVVIGTNTGSFNFVKIIGSDRDILVGSEIVITGLPSSAPAGSGRVWNDSGTLKIT